MAVYLIAAIGRNNELGKDNGLIWRFKEDMKFFKETTMGSAVIMGRKTFESLPKALTGRRNIVITSNPDYHPEGAETVHTVSEALSIVGDSDAYIIGGGRVYAEMLGLCDALYLTEIDDECDTADTYFPLFDKDKYDKEIINEYTADNIKFSHVVYRKRRSENEEV